MGGGGTKITGDPKTLQGQVGDDFKTLSMTEVRQTPAFIKLHWRRAGYKTFITTASLVMSSGTSS